VDVLSERERQVLEEIEREVAADDPRLAASLRTPGAAAAAPHDRWPYTAAVVAAWALVVTCLLLGLPAAMLGAAALAMLAVAVRRWQFPAPHTRTDGPTGPGEGAAP
jgi:hypothetical protein